MPPRPLNVQSVPYSGRVDRDQDEPRWLGPEELAAWMSYVAATTLLDSALDRQLQREAGMPLAYYQILAMLADVPERTLRMSDLAAITQSSQSRLSHAVTRLERRGWILRRPCSEDRRSTWATLTDTGYAALAAAAPGHVAAVREHLFDQLSCEQVRQLQAICRTVLAGMAMVPDVPPRVPAPEPSPSS
jgi:DNA-binding MarR family transcriptional regulator